MADSSSIRKRFNCVSRQRVTDTNINELSSTANDMCSETVWDLVCDHNAIVNGFNVTQSTLLDFDVSSGIVVIDGEVVKETGVNIVSLSSEKTGNPRTDIIEISGIGDTLNLADSASVVALGALSRTTITSEAVGTGTGSQEEWDLDYPGVDNSTLRVFLDGTETGGWNLSPKNGIRTTDYIIFGVAPASGSAITASYDYLTGGIEAASSQYTRTRRQPTFAVVEGTPGGGTPSPTSGSVPVAYISIPANWTGGSTPSAPIVFNNLKKFAIYPDSFSDDEAAASSSLSGKVHTVLSGMSLIQEGYRLNYYLSDQIQVGPGFSSNNGWSTQNRSTTSLTLQAATPSSVGYVGGGAGWYYVYGLIDASTVLPGGELTLDVSQTAPNSRNIKQGSSAYMYLGEIYVSNISPITIQPFYTDGDWVYWENPSFISASSGTSDINVSAWCPETARIIDAMANSAVTRNIATDSVAFSVKSHLSASALPHPFFSDFIEPPSASQYLSNKTGRIKVEDSGGARYINTSVGVTGSPSVATTEVKILGYLRDFRVMSRLGFPSFY